MTLVVNKYKICMDDSDVEYIGRGSVWGNPYPMRREDKSESERDRVIKLYRWWLWKEIREGRVTKEMLIALDGKRLACYCAPQRCHGDVLVAAIQWAKGETK